MFPPSQSVRGRRWPCSIAGATPEGRNYRRKTKKQGSAPAASSYLEALGNRDYKWSVLAAAGPAEAALEMQIQKNGYFTYNLLSALRGDADANRDGVTSAELRDYLRERVPEQVRPAELAEQTPEFRGSEAPVVLVPVAKKPS